jgi:LacI family transcriptional regulator
MAAPSRRVTLLDIAHDAGVSRATVSLVLRESPLVADETRERVRASMRKLGYVYNRAAASLRTRQTKTIGLIITDINNPYFAEIVVGIESRLDTAGYVVLLGNTAEMVSKQERMLATMQEFRVGGILLCPAPGETNPDLFRRAYVPIVLFARYIPGITLDYVGIDNVYGAEKAVEHLLALGHRRIAFVGGSPEVTSRRERLAGYEQTLSKNGIAPDPACIVSSEATRDSGYNAMLPLLDLADPPTAALCFNDVVAFGAILALVARGRTPGHDFPVIGYDDIPEAALFHPKLTTVAVHPRRIGDMVAELLLERMSQPDTPPQQLILSPQLIIRESCGGAHLKEQ